MNDARRRLTLDQRCAELRERIAARKRAAAAQIWQDYQSTRRLLAHYAGSRAALTALAGSVLNRFGDANHRHSAEQ